MEKKRQFEPVDLDELRVEDQRKLKEYKERKRKEKIGELAFKCLDLLSLLDEDLVKEWITKKYPNGIGLYE